MCKTLGMVFLNDNRMKEPEAHDDIQRDGRVQVISIQTEIPENNRTGI